LTASVLHSLGEEGVARPLLVWRFERPMAVASTALVGGGIGLRHWVLNAQVPMGYARLDPERHIAELAASLGLESAGVGMLTAADVTRSRTAHDEGASVEVTVGLSDPTWAAAPDPTAPPASAGTINLVAFVPQRLEDGALLNALCTLTEAKTQALHLAGIEGTGTPTDAIAVVCPDGPVTEQFGGPRSRWGARLARAALEAIGAGCADWLAGSAP
jgi:adenosylcobinamide hydrolase